jgi:hypothetical protein
MVSVPSAATARNTHPSASIKDFLVDQGRIRTIGEQSM